MANVLSKYTNNRDNNFNLIRFIAASLVLYSHSFALATGVSDAQPLRNSIGMTWGNIAVDIFFVTSGFLIANSFFARNNILAFVWARILRIYPALIVAMIFCVFIVGMFFTTYLPSDYLSNPQTYKYFLKNSTLFSITEHHLPGVFATVPYKYFVNGPLWTLPFEIRAYACLAIIFTVLVFIQKWQCQNILKVAFLGIAITAYAAIFIDHFQLFSPVIPFIRFFSLFFVGAAFYVYRNIIYLSSRLFFLVLTILLLSIVHKELFFVIYIILLPYLVFYLAYIPSGSIRGFNKVGDYSYGMYIYAWPVQQSVAAKIPDVSVGSMIIISFAITLTLSFLSWHLIEKRCLKMKGSYAVFGQMLQNMRLKNACTWRK